MQYGIVSGYFALTLPADVVIASSGPLTVALPGLLARYLKRRKLVFEVRDLWPDGAIELGLIRNPILKRIAYWIERRCYFASARIVTLSPGMQADIESRFGLQNVSSVTNSANIELFVPGIDHALRNRWGCYAVYTGNIGEVNNSWWLVDAARELKKRNLSGINILMIGDGQLRNQIIEAKKNEKLEWLQILDPVPKEEIVKYVQNALVSIVPLKDMRIFDTSSPNKFFESLAAGVPVVQNTKGWMMDFLDKHTVGYTLSARDSSALVDLLIRLRDDQGLVKSMGLRARAVAEKDFDKRILAAKMLAELEKQ